MLHHLSIFFITAAISFAGSIQLGPVNLAIMKTVLEGRSKAALWTGAGVCLPEFIYSAFALFASAWLMERKLLLEILEWGVVPLLLGLGIFNLLKKKQKTMDDSTPGQKAADFLRGMLLSFLNPQLLPFWLMILVMLNGYAFFRIDTLGDKIAFIIGTGAGEFVLIALVVYFTRRFREYLLNKMKNWNINRVFGWLFIVLAVAQSVKLIFQVKK